VILDTNALSAVADGDYALEAIFREAMAILCPLLCWASTAMASGNRETMRDMKIGWRRRFPATVCCPSITKLPGTMRTFETN